MFTKKTERMLGARLFPQILARGYVIGVRVEENPSNCKMQSSEFVMTQGFGVETVNASGRGKESGRSIRRSVPLGLSGSAEWYLRAPGNHQPSSPDIFAGQVPVKRSPMTRSRYNLVLEVNSSSHYWWLISTSTGAHPRLKEEGPRSTSRE